MSFNSPYVRLLTLLACSTTPQWSMAEPLRFNRDIRPILSDSCFACHGPDQSNRQADLRLDQPGDVDWDELLRRIDSSDPVEKMPPADSHKSLTQYQKDLLKRWIAEGASFESHWSFIRPAKPGLGNCIDDFVRQELSKRDLSPASPADAATLVRRVALDLTGLPPTLEEQSRFASPESYEAMVDYFLAKPAYGEHMAVAWLDAARYADSNGYQVDRDRELWPWRDWVVRAFNDNLPFDQFTIQQLAGDLLPNPTLEQRIATGFNRNHMLNEEGGIIAEEFLAEYTADRVETTAAVWLGQTFNCCRCHDHKYDPFTQRDFYAMKAYFHNVPELGIGNYSNHIRTNAPPFVKLPAPKVEAKLAALQAKTNEVEQRLQTIREEPLDAWIKNLLRAEIQWQAIDQFSAVQGAVVEAEEQPDSAEVADKVIAIGPQEPGTRDYNFRVQLPNGPITALRLECAAGDSPADVQLVELKLGPNKLRALDAAHANLLDGKRDTSVQLSLQAGESTVLLLTLETPTEVREEELTFSLESATGATRWRVAVTADSPELMAPESILAVLRIGASERTELQQKQIADFRLQHHAEYRRLSEEATKLRKQIATVELEIPTTLVMEEQSEPRPTYVLMRGAYDKPGEQVAMATPAVLPPPSPDLPQNRLGLAMWLVSPENPLTARVTVNRIWQQFFGVGLVRSSEDFGSQGDPPSHPELLDWLAVTFQESGWDVKGLVKAILMSHTYRQSSRHPEGAEREIDPANIWLARGPRYRLPAEVIRDQALAASGLLVETMGGPTVKPYHPPGLYEQVVNQRDNPQATYTQGQGPDLYRRSLYTYWKRSVPHPAMMLFDVPFREVCSMRRTRSNTPLQALNLLNDPTYVEASRFLAQRMILQGGDSDASRLLYGFRLLLAREPSQPELDMLCEAVRRWIADFQRDSEAAQQLLSVGDSQGQDSIPPAILAAYTTLASTLLNLDETISKE